MKTYTTDYVYTERNDMTQTDYIDLLLNECKKGAFCEVLYDASGAIVGVHQVLDSNIRISRGEESSVIGFDTAQYGGDMTAPGGVSGRMVSQGWLYGMEYASGEKEGVITVGDGNHVTYVFEERYKVTDQTGIYLIGDDYGSIPSTLDEIQAHYVTETDENGDIYHTKDRYTVVCIFADDYHTDYQDSVVEEMYVYKTPYQQPDDYLFVPDDAPNHSDYRENNDAFNKNYMPESHPEMTSANPFCLMENKLYWIGDDEVTVMLMVDEYAPGEYNLAVLDMGWPSSGYQYIRNIEKLGFDPRDLTVINLTHGHVDHYGGAWDFAEMIQRAGGNVNFKDDNGEPWDIAPPLTDATARFMITDFIPIHEWMGNFESDDIQIYYYITPGHSMGCPSFIIRVVADEDDEYFEAGEVVEFSFMGGYGALANLNRGYLRNAFEYSLRYMESYIIPMMEAEADYIYCIPGHTNHYPIMEVNKAYQKINEGKAYGDDGYVPFMACYTEGAESIINQLEKRQATQVYDSYFQEWVNDPRPIGYASDPLDPDYKVTGTSQNYQTNDTYGPFKREAGQYEIEILTDTSNETGAVIHGYNAWLNPSEYFEGLTNIDGEDLSEGFVIEKDAYVHDPDGWYVQLCVHVNDGYTGNIVTGDPEIPSGPVESLQGDGWFEVLRTERLNSREEAEALLSALQTGSVYTVMLDQSSEIQLAEDLADTFQPVGEKP
ncbi:MAG: MBL fold metallo-hydrolase [Clostridia bacterium]|nr:MBL fold metallo-hydrolase [Clostridia bacterium]